MPLNISKRYVSKKDLEDKQSRAATLKQAIEMRKELSKGGEDAMRTLIKYLEGYKQTTQTLQLLCFQYRGDAGEQNNSLKAHVHAGELNVLNFVLDLLTNSKNALSQHQAELDDIEKQLTEWKEYSVRDE